MATYTNLNLTRLGNGALQAFVKSLLPLNAFSTKYEFDSNGRQQGNVMVVPLTGTLTATTFGGTYAICGGSKTVVTVTINKHKIVTVGQQDLDALNNSDSALESYFYQMGAALGTLVVEDVLTLVTTANFGAVGTAVASTALDVPGLRAGKLALDQGNAPQENRSAIMDVVGMDALLAVTNFVQAYMFADNNVLKEGRVMRALGMDLRPVNGSLPAANSVNVFFSTASAIAIGMRYVQPQRSDRYDNAQAFTDPRIGATFGLRDFFLPDTGTRFIAFECNYGYSVGISQGARIFKRTD